MPTKAELKKAAKPIKLKVRKGDTVMIISGKDKGEIGYVEAVAPREGKVLVLKFNEDNPDSPLPLNAAIKHRKPRTTQEKGTRLQIPVPIHVSNVMVVDPKTNQPTRLGRRVEDGKLVRYAKKSGEVIAEVKLEK